MSHRIIGLDLGSYSVKVVQVESRFGSPQIVGFDEERIWPDEDAAHQDDAPRPVQPSQDQAAVTDDTEDGEGELEEYFVEDPSLTKAVAALTMRGALEGDVVVVSYGLQSCLHTQIELPFSQRRQIEEVLPMQLEDRFPVEPDELVVDFMMSDQDPESGLRKISVVATKTEELGGFLAQLGQWGVDPRTIEVGPARLLAARYILSPHESLDSLAIVDIGHKFTDVCFVEKGNVARLRRLRIGGARFTERLAEAFGISQSEAEELKHNSAYVDPSDSAPPTLERGQAVLREVCRDCASELSEELQRTLRSFFTGSGKPVERIALCGGGSLLRGLSQFLASGLTSPVEVMQIPQFASEGTGATVRAVGALGLAARGAGQRVGSRFDLRKGPFGYRGDFDFIRARAVPLMIMVALLIVAIVFSLIAKRSALEARRDAYETALCNTSEALMGQPYCDPADVMAQLTASESAIDIPEFTAYEIFRDISAELVYIEEDYSLPIEIERMQVDIQRNVITIRGSTDSAASVDEIVEQLAMVNCVDNLSPESTTQNRATGLFDFVLQAEASCE